MKFYNCVILAISGPLDFGSFGTLGTGSDKFSRSGKVERLKQKNRNKILGKRGVETPGRLKWDFVSPCVS